MTTEDNSKRHFVIEWRKGFQVNIPEIDAEHQRLFTLIKALDLESVDQTLEELLDYVVVHFSHEQELMEKSGYPAFEQHLQLHENFASHVADFLGNADAWNEERIQELRRFLNKWLVGHIMTHDLRFGKWYADNVGVMPAHEPEPVAAQVRAPAQGDPRAHLAKFQAARAQAARTHAVKEEMPSEPRGFFARLFGRA